MKKKTSKHSGSQITSLTGIRRGRANTFDVARKQLVLKVLNVDDTGYWVLHRQILQIAVVPHLS